MNLLKKYIPTTFKFKAQVPNLQNFIGRTVKIGDQIVKIETIVGSRVKPAFYEINGTHWIGMLRFHAQMEGDTSISEVTFKQFEEMEMEAEFKPVEVEEDRSISEVTFKQFKQIGTGAESVPVEEPVIMPKIPGEQ